MSEAQVRYTEPFCIIGSKGRFHQGYERYLPPLEYFIDETPIQEVINFYRNIDDKTELFLREKLHEIKGELQEHYKHHSLSDKKYNKDYY